MQPVLDVILSPKGLAALSSVLGSLVLLVLGTGLVRRRRVALATYHAFHIVEDVAAECRADGKDFPFLTKAAAGLQYANDWMASNGWRPLKPGEEERAELTFKSLHGERKAAEPRGVAGLLLLVMLAPVALGLTGCSLFRSQVPTLPPVTECEAWRLAELSWAAVDLYVRQSVEIERSRACLPSAPVPPAAVP
jgi:hypothetical protein